MSEQTGSGTARKKAVKKKAVPAPVPDVRGLVRETVTPLVAELREAREEQNRQLQGVLEVFGREISRLEQEAHKRDEQRRAEFERLLDRLGEAFSQVSGRVAAQESRMEEAISRLSESLILEHRQLQEEVLEQEKLQEKKLEYLDRRQSREVRRTRWIAVPAMVVGVLALGYMFYTVHIMERAMTRMSRDMGEMKTSVAGLEGSVRQMSVRMDQIGADTRYMSASLGQVGRDVNAMTRQVGPAMKGMRRAMPWSP